MRVPRDAVFGLLGLLAGTGLSTFWRVSVEVSRCAFTQTAVAPRSSGDGARAPWDGGAGPPADGGDDDALSAPPLDAASFRALPAAGVVVPTPQASSSRRAIPRFSLRTPASPSGARGSAGGAARADAAAGADARRARADAQLWNVSHSLSHGELWTEQWTRRYRFGPARLLDPTISPPVFALELTRELLVPRPPSAGERPVRAASGAPSSGVDTAAALRARFDRPPPMSDEGRERARGACGDSLRVRFASTDALFAPLSVRERPTACGEYIVRFRPPALEPGVPARYALELRLLHVDGEGLADPPPNLQLYTREWDGPSRSFAWAIASCNATCQEMGPRFFNADLHVRGELRVVSPPSAAAADGAPPGAAAAAAPTRPLPLCVDGTSDGAYLRNRDPHFPAFAAEPWVWVPYDCALRHFSPQRLRECIQSADALGGTGGGGGGGGGARAVPAVRFLGESTLIDAARAWLLQLRPDGSSFHWPNHFPSGGRNVMRELMQANTERNGRGEIQPVAFREQHGSRILLAELRGWAKGGYAEGASLSDPLGASGATVLGQAHNDAMKVTFAEAKQNVFEIMRLLRAYALQNPERRFIWVTGPPRHYKEKNAPGHTECRAGRTAGDTRSCHSPVTNECELPVDVDAGARELGGALPTAYRCARFHADARKWFAVLLFNTYDRVRRANVHAVREVRRSLGARVAIVDYFKILEPLPAMYSVDGVHWGCDWGDVLATRDGPDQCRGLGNAVLANVVANVVCNPRRDANPADSREPRPETRARPSADARAERSERQTAAGAGEEDEQVMPGEPHDGAPPLVAVGAAERRRGSGGPTGVARGVELAAPSGSALVDSSPGPHGFDFVGRAARAAA